MVVCDKKTFEAEVLQEQRTVLVDFFGDGCAPCKALMPHIEAVSYTHLDVYKRQGMRVAFKNLPYDDLGFCT